jgi:hypothetical protein
MHTPSPERAYSHSLRFEAKIAKRSSRVSPQIAVVLPLYAAYVAMMTRFYNRRIKMQA